MPGFSCRTWRSTSLRRSAPGTRAIAFRRVCGSTAKASGPSHSRRPDIQKARRTLARAQRGIHASRKAIRSTHVESKQQRWWTTSVLDPRGHARADRVPGRAAAGCGFVAHLAERGGDRGDRERSRPRRGHHDASQSRAAFYGARLQLDMALDRSHPEWGARLMFFRCGDLIVEVAHDLKQGAFRRRRTGSGACRGAR